MSKVDWLDVHAYNIGQQYGMDSIEYESACQLLDLAICDASIGHHSWSEAELQTVNRR